MIVQDDRGSLLTKGSLCNHFYRADARHEISCRKHVYLKNKAIDKRADLTEAEEFEVVKREIRQTKETMDLAPADREDIREACAARLSVYQEFAPEEMSEDAIRAEVQAVLTALGITEPSAKDKGKVMKELMPKVKGKADGSLVNRIVGEILA